MLYYHNKGKGYKLGTKPIELSTMFGWWIMMFDKKHTVIGGPYADDALH